MALRFQQETDMFGNLARFILIAVISIIIFAAPVAAALWMRNTAAREVQMMPQALSAQPGGLSNTLTIR